MVTCSSADSWARYCSLSVGVIFISYALQVRFKPYAHIDAASHLDLHNAVVTPGARLIYVRALRCVERMLTYAAAGNTLF